MMEMEFYICCRDVALCGGVDFMVDDDLGGKLPGWYVVKDDNDFRWRRM